VWLIRAGSRGEGEQVALEKSVIGIGYGGFEVSDSIKDIKTFKQHYLALHPDDKSVNRVVPQIWAFLRNIKQGDIVVLPLLAKNSKLVAVGRIEGDFQANQLHSELTIIRPVKWFKKDVARTDFKEIDGLGYRGTVRYLGGPVVAGKIKTMLKRLGVSEMEIEAYSANEVLQIQQIKPRIPLTIEELANITYLPTDMLSDIEALLTEKKQIIFYGPPGTSKTFCARKFGEYFTRNSDNVEVIQFHPSYSYEDFIEGIKPNLSKTGLANGFSRQDGIFKKLINKCIANSNSKYVLIIDEINRGNIAKIFGELIYLLEYREDKIPLTYSPSEKFSIPPNLYLLGTMNSADRSIAFVDYALRRRFYFIDFYPDLTNGLLNKWFQDNDVTKEVDPSTIVDMLSQMNQKIRVQLGKEYQIGHSYFMVKNLNHDKVRMIIKYAIKPLIEQYQFGKTKKVNEIIEVCHEYFPSIDAIDPSVD
jgi:MoxR-like ATPase